MGRIVAVIITLAVILAVNGRGALVNKEVAVRALDTQGYSNVKITDHSWFAVGMRGCDGKDAARFTALATNLAGKQVQLYVCTGWVFKGATIRTR